MKWSFRLNVLFPKYQFSKFVWIQNLKRSSSHLQPLPNEHLHLLDLLHHLKKIILKIVMIISNAQFHINLFYSTCAAFLSRRWRNSSAKMSLTQFFKIIIFILNKHVREMIKSKVYQSLYNIYITSHASSNV